MFLDRLDRWSNKRQGWKAYFLKWMNIYNKQQILIFCENLTRRKYSGFAKEDFQGFFPSPTPFPRKLQCVEEPLGGKLAPVDLAAWLPLGNSLAN